MIDDLLTRMDDCIEKVRALVTEPMDRAGERTLFVGNPDARVDFGHAARAIQAEERKRSCQR
jgi:hypothetical protein